MVVKASTGLLLVFCGVVWGHLIKDDPPQFSQTYRVSGVLQLPYAEIIEPFTVWYDGPNKRSRIDYYNGLVKNILRGDAGDYGASYKVAFMTNYQVTNQLSCFGSNGSSEAPVAPQTIFPDTNGMKFTGTEQINGILCKAFTLVVVNGKKTSTYTLWVDKNTGAPIRYEMMGYDSLIGSHFDKYVLDYQDYQGNINIDPSTFSVGNLTCTGFPGPGKERHLHFNPMQEFVHGDDSHIPPMFQAFKKQHGRNYDSHMEHEIRQNHFRQNVRYIHSKNRQGLTYTMAINHLADHSDKELKMMNKFRRTTNYEGIQGQPFNMAEFANAPIPDQMDWRLYGAVTPVKDQAVCGSCWSFGTTGTIEGAYFVKTGNLVRLSQQELMDCSWGEGNNGCDGGEDFRAYNWIMKSGGLSMESLYGHYLAVDGKCHSKDVEAVVKLSGYVNVTAYDQQALKTAIALKGPVSVAIDASHKSLSFYANGVYYEPKCGSKPDDLDHAVLAVGYGVLQGQAYWLVKNSWSTYWGNDGYVLMAQKDNNCGVATSPTYPIIA